MSIEEVRYYKPSEVAKILNRGEQFVWFLLRSRQLGAIRNGRTYRVPEADLKAFLAKGYQPALEGSESQNG